MILHILLSIILTILCIKIKVPIFTKSVIFGLQYQILNNV